MHHNAAYYGPEQTQSVSSLSNAYSNGDSSHHPCMQTSVDISSHAIRMDSSSNMSLVQSSNVGMIQGMNGGMLKAEAGYAGTTSPFLFVGANGSGVPEMRSAIGDPSVSSFSSVESNSQPPNETMLDPDTFGFLGQIPRNFSFSDLTADFSNTG